MEKLHNEEFRNLFSSQNIIRMTKPRRIRLVWHVENVGDVRSVYNILIGNPEVKSAL
jgi:hypothetical protein